MFIHTLTHKLSIKGHSSENFEKIHDIFNGGSLGIFEFEDSGIYVSMGPYDRFLKFLVSGDCFTDDFTGEAIYGISKKNFLPNVKVGCIIGAQILSTPLTGKILKIETYYNPEYNYQALLYRYDCEINEFPNGLYITDYYTLETKKF